MKPMEKDTKRSLEVHDGDKICIFYQSYGRITRHIEKFCRRETKVSPKQFAKAVFEEARRRNECVKCGSCWQPGWRWLHSSIKEHSRSRLQRGETEIDLVSDLVIGLEEESNLQIPTTEGAAEKIPNDVPHDV